MLYHPIPWCYNIMLLVYYSIMSMVISSRENLQALLTSDKRKRPRNLSRTSVAVIVIAFPEYWMPPLETLVLGGWDYGARGCIWENGMRSIEKQCDLVDKVDRNHPKSNCDKADLLLQLNGYCLLFHENDTPTV